MKDKIVRPNYHWSVWKVKISAYGIGAPKDSYNRHYNNGPSLRVIYKKLVIKLYQSYF